MWCDGDWSFTVGRVSDRLKQIAVMNEQIVARGSYRTGTGETVEIGERVRAAKVGTVSYTPGQLGEIVAGRKPGAGSPVVEVTGEGSVEAAA